MLKKPVTPIPFFIPRLTIITGVILVALCLICLATVDSRSMLLQVLILVAATTSVILLVGGGYLLGKRRQEIDRDHLWQLNIHLNAKLRELGRPPIDIGETLDKLSEGKENNGYIDTYV